MARNRVLSFMSQLSGGQRDSRSRTPSLSPPPDNRVVGFRQAAKGPESSFEPFPELPPSANFNQTLPPTPPRQSPTIDDTRIESNSSRRTSSFGRERSTSRPQSIAQTYQPPLMDINEDTIPELQPIFTFLNSHGNKLYQEGYFLKLDDQNAQGRPNLDRTWHECFAQLVGTVLSLWDAADLDAAGEDGEVLPKFINITDASIKIIESLQISSDDNQGLQNVLSLSTAGRNRYLLHFNSHHSLVQWAAAIRLAIYEQSTLQEAYTGALIAGKAKTLNNINVIMERATLPTEEWVRVRFGAGVPWRRCWCVITPPSLKDIQRMQKELKKRSPYDRAQPPALKGDIKFFDLKVEGRKQKKAHPIASISDAFSAFAIYPQTKSLIDASTLVKIEGNITIHSDPPSATEGFVFIMPESRPAVSGFETLLRFLFPAWDTFALYGRPGKLAASVLDTRSLMFAMPKHRRYGYLEILDVSSLLTTESSDRWSEKEWRKRMKEMTSQRVSVMEEGRRQGRSTSRNGRHGSRLSLGMGANSGIQKPRVGFADDSVSLRSTRSFSPTGPPISRLDSPQSVSDPDRSLGGDIAFAETPQFQPKHRRQSSDGGIGPPALERITSTNDTYTDDTFDSRQHGRSFTEGILRDDEGGTAGEYLGADENAWTTLRELEQIRQLNIPQPVAKPPAFSHAPQVRPTGKPYYSPELRRANSRLSSSTLSQLAKAGRVAMGMDANAEQLTARGSGEFLDKSGSAL